MESNDVVQNLVDNIAKTRGGLPVVDSSLGNVDQVLNLKSYLEEVAREAIATASNAAPVAAAGHSPHTILHKIAELSGAKRIWGWIDSAKGVLSGNAGKVAAGVGAAGVLGAAGYGIDRALAQSERRASSAAGRDYSRANSAMYPERPASGLAASSYRASSAPRAASHFLVPPTTFEAPSSQFLPPFRAGPSPRRRRTKSLSPKKPRGKSSPGRRHHARNSPSKKSRARTSPKKSSVSSSFKVRRH
jgi:hypothetical protein